MNHIRRNSLTSLHNDDVYRQQDMIEIDTRISRRRIGRRDVVARTFTTSHISILHLTLGSNAHNTLTSHTHTSSPLVLQNPSSTGYPSSHSMAVPLKRAFFYQDYVRCCREPMLKIFTRLKGLFANELTPRRQELVSQAFSRVGGCTVITSYSMTI
jgi:hypothetical protein